MSVDVRQSPRPGLVLAQWCRLLFAGLIDGGVRHAVISPGSRSTPLVQQALKEESLCCHSVVDERSAGFFALGLAKSTGAPVLLICTSGSALSHYLPALIEAQHSGSALVILSADRPATLQDCGAPQTIDQLGIFGSFATKAPRLGEPSSELSSLRAVRRVGVQTVNLATSSGPGPVHLNFPVAKPLEHREAEGASELEFVAGVDELLKNRPQVIAGSPADNEPRAIRELLAELQADKRTLSVTVGPCSQAELNAAKCLAAVLDCPLWGEFDTEQIPFAMAGALKAWADGTAEAPERVLHVGPPCVTGDWARFVKSGRVDLWVLPGRRWLDSESQASRVILGDIRTLLEQMFDLVDGEPGARSQNYSELAAPRDLVSVAGLKPSDSLSEVHALAQLLESLPQGINIFLANSLSVRLGACLLGLAKGIGEVYLQRGANGIDGHIASAAGLTAGAERPTLLVIGDVAAAHDLGSLAVARGLPAPLVIVILDNQGGRLFDHLPASEDFIGRPEEWRYWQTAPQIDWEAAAQTFGLAFECCEKIADLTPAVQGGFRRKEATLLHVVCAGEETRALLQELRERAAP